MTCNHKEHTGQIHKFFRLAQQPSSSDSNSEILLIRLSNRQLLGFCHTERKPPVPLLVEDQ